MTRGIVSLVFRCRQVGGLPQPTSEATEVAWLDRDAVTDRMAEAFAVRLLTPSMATARRSAYTMASAFSDSHRVPAWPGGPRGADR